MLDKKEFDLWADGYDKTVGISDEKNTYPFAGYKKVLGFIFQTIVKTENAIVLDIGFGTGTLTTKLYEQGCSIYGQDFSSRMIELASEKMPNAHLYQGDFSKGLVEPLRNFRYDYIVATYSLHHLTDAQKNEFLLDLRNHLKENGKIIIGDVAFETRKDFQMQNILCLYSTFAENICQGIFAFANNFILKHGGSLGDWTGFWNRKP